MRSKRMPHGCAALLLAATAAACAHTTAAQTGGVQTTQPATAPQRREADAASYAGFAAAVSALAPAGGTLVVSTPQTVAADQTIPPGVFLRFERGGYLTASAPVTLSIREPVMAGRWQIFAGNVVARFEASYPEAFYPEWWGARGDGASDDLPAFDAMTNALRAAHPARVLLGAKTYYLAGRWDIDATLVLEGPGSGSGYMQPQLKFAPNTAGLVVHDLSTRTGTKDGRLARSSTLRNLHILGQVGPTTHTVSIAGLTLTRLSGASFADGAGHHEGNTVSLRNASGSTYEYMIDSFTDADHLKLKAPRIMILTANGSTVLQNGMQSSHSFWSQFWAGNTIQIAGKTYTIASVDTTKATDVGSFGTMTLTTPVTGLAHNLSNGTAFLGEATVGGATAASAAARPNLYHGLDARTPVRIADVYVDGFAGNGLNLDSSLLPTAYPGSEPNVNLALVEHSTFINNLGNGVYTRGVNSNQIHFAANDATNNHGAGFAEFGFLGNHYYTNHASFDFWGGFVSVQNSVNLSSYYSDYTEAGMPASLLNQNSVFVGGDHGAGVAGPGGGVQHLGGWTVLDSLKVVNSHAQTDKLVGVALGGALAQPNTLLSFGAAEDAGNTVAGGTPASFERYAYQFGYNQLAPGWYSLYKGNTAGIGTNYATDQAGSVVAFSGSNAAEGPGKLWLYRGIDFIGAARDVGLQRTAAHTLQVTDGARGAGNLTAASVSAPSIYTPLKTDAFTPTLTLDFAQGHVHTITLTGDVTRLAFANLAAGGEYVVRVAQDARGGHTIAWTNVRWAGGTAPRLTAGPLRVDIFRFISPDGATLEEVSRALDVR